MDTKGDELNYLAARIRALGSSVRTVDVSANPRDGGGGGGGAPDYTIDDVMFHHPVTAGQTLTASDLPDLPRAEAVREVSAALRVMLSRAHAAGEVSGVIGIGGSGGTSLITAAMKEIPVGTPKLMVSTVAAGTAWQILLATSSNPP